MANGTIPMTTAGSGILYGQILWTSSSNGTEANSSVVTASVQIKRSDAGYTTTGTWKGSVTVGSTTSEVSLFTAVGGEWVTVATLTATVNHNANGSGSCYIYSKINGPTETTMEGTSVSGGETVQLDTISRYAYFVSAPDFHDEESPVIHYVNPFGAQVDKLEACISLDGAKDDIAYRAIPVNDGSYTFALTEAERDVLRSATTDSNSRSIKFFLRTKIGELTGRNSLARTFTIHNPAPVISPVIVDCNETTVKLTGTNKRLIRYCSDAQITMGITAVKKASIVNQRVTCCKNSRTKDGVMYAVEDDSFVFTAKDSRGNGSTMQMIVSSIPYFFPTCQLEASMPDTSGTLTIRVSGKYYNNSFGAKANSLQVFYRYKQAGSAYSQWQSMTVTVNGHTYQAAAEVGDLDYRSGYIVQAYAKDALHQVETGEKKVKATPVFDWGPDDFRFNVPVAMPMNGLGVTGNQMQMLADANEATNTGWYRLSSNTQNGVGAAALLRVDSFSSSSLRQTLFTGGYVRERCYQNGVWSPWEWPNPPLYQDMEYRTTERFNGKPVYVKAVDFGALPNSGNKNVVYYPTSPGATPICATAVLSTGCVLSAGYGRDRSISGAYGLFLDTTKFNVRILTEGDFSGVSAVVVVKYVKDTDT